MKRGNAYKHGMINSPEYTSWTHMKQRCSKLDDKNYALYGGRGITYDPRWEDFENFYRDMGPKPGPGYGIDRIDNDGNYCKENCRWATQAEQVRNYSRTYNVTYQGKTQCLKDWCKELNVNYGTVTDRIYNGMDPVEALTKPAQKHKWNSATVLLVEKVTHADKTQREKAEFLGYTSAGYREAAKRAERAARPRKKISIEPLEGGLL